jgi:uncharacterized protein (TIGR02677 family)
VEESREPRPFAHVDVQLAPLYRRVMRTFVANKQRFVVHLRPEDVAEALRHDGGPQVTQDAVDEALRKLTEWGNLRDDPDTNRVTTVEDFYRTRYLYQLSREGEAAERALEVYEAEIGRHGELQTVALEDIRVRLRALAEFGAEPDPAVAHNLLLELSNRLDSLAANAGAFMSSLQRTIDLQDVDEEAFLAYKDRLISYLERFVSALTVHAHDIATSLRALSEERVHALLRLATERELADVAPDADGDASPFEVRLTVWRNRWSGLWSWFVGDHAHPSQAALLRQRARKAIPYLLAAIGVLQERRAGRSDRSADFRELARWFAEVSDDGDAHRLWRAAFGLASARHLAVESGAGRPEVPASTSWLDAPPTAISARLRATGHYQRRGAPSRVRDRSTAREHLARQVAAERAQLEAAKERLATGEPMRLSDVASLDRDEFALFLRLLGEALAAGPTGPAGRVTTRTGDGSLEVTLTPLPRGRVAHIVTPDGTFHGPDHELTVVDLTASYPTEAVG